MLARIDPRRRRWAWALTVLAACRHQATVAADEPRRVFAPLDPPRAVQVAWDPATVDYVPAGTAAALDWAMADGCEWLVLDVALTRDGVPVLLGRRSDDPLDVSNLTLDDYRQRDLGQGLGRRWPASTPLTLDEALGQARRKINLILRCADAAVGAAAARAVVAAELSDQVVITVEGETVPPNAANESPNPVAASDDATALARVGRCRVLSHAAPPAAGDAESGGLPTMVVLPARAADEAASPLTRELVDAWQATGALVYISDVGLPTDEPARGEQMALLWQTQPDGIWTSSASEWLARAARLSPGEGADPARVEVVHHRGANRYAPENTWAALRQAVRLAADWIEIDIRETTDGEAFLLHDTRLDRTTDRSGPLAELTAAEAATIDAGSWFASRRESLPRLSEVFQAVARDPQWVGVQLYLDAKAIAPEKLARLIAEYQLEERSLVFQGPGYLARVKAANPRARLMPPLYQAQAAESLARTLDPYAFDTSWEILSPELIARCHDLGVRVFSDAPGDLRSAADYRRVIGWGIDAIQTDHPLVFSRALELESAAR